MSAPPSFSVTARLAVSLVTWRQGRQAQPGQRLLLTEAIADQIETGISAPAHSILSKPRSARADP